MAEPRSQFPVALYLERFGIPSYDVSTAGYQPPAAPSLTLAQLVDDARKMRAPLTTPNAGIRHTVVTPNALIYKPLLGCWVEMLTVQIAVAHVFATRTNPGLAPIPAGPTFIQQGELALPGTWYYGVPAAAQFGQRWSIGTYTDGHALLWVPQGMFLYIDGDGASPIVSAFIREPRA